MVESGRVQAPSNKSSREIVVTAASSSWAPSRTAITRAIIPRWRSRKGKIENICNDYSGYIFNALLAVSRSSGLAAARVG